MVIRTFVHVHGGYNYTSHDELLLLIENQLSIQNHYTKDAHTQTHNNIESLLRHDSYLDFESLSLSLAIFKICAAFFFKSSASCFSRLANSSSLLASSLISSASAFTSCAIRRISLTCRKVPGTLWVESSGERGGVPLGYCNVCEGCEGRGSSR